MTLENNRSIFSNHKLKRIDVKSNSFVKSQNVTTFLPKKLIEGRAHQEGASDAPGGAHRPDATIIPMLEQLSV